MKPACLTFSAQHAHPSGAQSGAAGFFASVIVQSICKQQQVFTRPFCRLDCRLILTKLLRGVYVFICCTNASLFHRFSPTVCAHAVMHASCLRAGFLQVLHTPKEKGVLHRTLCCSADMLHMHVVLCLY
jgi:hypothetical protein